MYNIILVKRIFYLMILKVSNDALTAVAMKPGPEDRWAWVLDKPTGLGSLSGPIWQQPRDV